MKFSVACCLLVFYVVAPGCLIGISLQEQYLASYQGYHVFMIFNLSSPSFSSEAP